MGHFDTNLLPMVDLDMWVCQEVKMMQSADDVKKKNSAICHENMPQNSSYPPHNRHYLSCSNV